MSAVKIESLFDNHPLDDARDYHRDHDDADERLYFAHLGSLPKSEQLGTTSRYYARIRKETR